MEDERDRGRALDEASKPGQPQDQTQHWIPMRQLYNAHRL